MNILITCAGRRNYLVDYFRSALSGNGKVYAANSTADSTALIIADKGFVVPPLNDPDYIEVIINICLKFDINAIVPVFDLELPILAKARERLIRLGVFPVVSSPRVIEICNDKLLSERFTIECSLQSPLTFIDLHSAYKALGDNKLKFPLIIKPRWGMGSIGIFEAGNETELNLFYSKVFNIISQTYLSLTVDHDIKQSVLIQEKITGQEYGLDVINNLEGKYITTFVKKKISMRSGETDGAVTKNEPYLQRIGEIISKKLGHIANLDIDIIKNDKGAFVIEMNPRFGGGYPFSHLAGADLPSAIISWLSNKVADPDWLSIEYDVVGYKGVLPIRASMKNIEFI